MNFSWQRQKIAMTPLFAASQIQSQISSQESSFSIGMIKATQQSLQFSPTQQEIGTLNWMNPTFQVPIIFGYICVREVFSIAVTVLFILLHREIFIGFVSF